MKIEIKTKKPLVLHFDDLVIGGTLEAFYFAYTFNLPIIYAEAVEPYFFEVHAEAGNKRELWHKLNFLICMAGKNPFAENCRQIAYIDKETLKVITFADKLYYLKFKKLWVFDDISFYRLPVQLDSAEQEIEIIDHFKILDGWVPQTDHIYREDKILNQFHFFKEKPHKKLKFKHFYVTSKISMANMYNLPEYFVRIRCEQILGSKKLEHLKRNNRTRQPLYEDIDNIIFCHSTFEEMYPYSHKRRKISYAQYLGKKLKLGS